MLNYPIWISLSQNQGNLPADQTDTITIFFNADSLDVATYNGSISILSNDVLNDSLNISITLLVYGIPELYYQPDSLFFDGSLGKTDTCWLYFSNIGSATLQANIEKETAGTIFSISPIDSILLQPDETDSIVTTFTPPDTGNFYNNLIITTNESDSSEYFIPLNGTGTAAFIDIFPDTLYFGNVRIDSTKETGFTVKNYGNDTLKIAISLQDSVFDITSDSLSILPGDSDTIFVAFTPVSEGMIEKELIIESNAFNADSLSISLIGIGVIPNIAVETDSLFFVAAVSDSTVKGLTVYNQGSDTLLIFNITTGTAQFKLISDTTFSLLPDSSDQISIQFMPSDTLDYADSLTIFSNDPDSESLNINLHGRGIVPFDYNLLMDLIQNWGKQAGDVGFEAAYDLNDDGKITVEDIQMFINGYYSE